MATIQPQDWASGTPAYQKLFPGGTSTFPEQGTLSPLSESPTTATPSPDLTTPQGQMSWVQTQLAGSKYATDDPNYWFGRINDTGGFTPENLDYWSKGIASGYWGSPAQVAAEAAKNNPFSDPATAPWASLVQQLTGTLQQPLDTTYLQPLLDYAKQYFQTLQGPAYTPDQLQLYKTTATDPITQQRDAEDQNIIQRFAAQGVPQSSGIVQDAILKNHRNADQLTTQANSNLALNAIGTQKQQLAQALNVGQTLAGILPSVQQQNESRALTGVNLLSQIPALADSRLAAANQTLGVGNASGSSAGQLLQLLTTAQQTGQINSQQFWNTFAQLLAGL